MLVDLKLGRTYDGFLFLAESVRNPPILQIHHHVELELCLVVRGTVTFVVVGRRFTFHRGMLFWLFPAQPHQLVERSNDAQYYVAVFKQSLITRACRSPGYAGLKRDDVEVDGVLHTMLRPDAFELIRKMMDSLMEGSLDPDVLNREAGYGVDSDFHYQHYDPDFLNAGLRHLLLVCWRLQSSSQTSGDSIALHPAVQKALALMSGRPEHQKLASLARQCGVSEDYLSRLFHRQIGVPISRYRNSLRLGRFWEAYRQARHRNISEAVYEAGFGSYAQFHRIFTQFHGCGPRAGLRCTG